MSRAKHRVYPELEYVYEHFKIKGHYKFENTDEVRNVLGFKFEETKGFDELSQDKQELAIRVFLKIINAHGLEWRDTFWPVSLKDKPNEKRVVLYCTSGKDTENSFVIRYDGEYE